MINLLPPSAKKQIRAARVNVVLLQVNFINIITVGLLVIILFFAYIALSVARTSAQQAVEDTNRQIISYEATQKEADVYRQNLALAKQIKSIQIRYSDALIKIGKALPDGVALSSLNLSPETIGQPIEVELSSSKYVDAIDIKEGLAKADLFEDVRFVRLEGSTLRPGDTTVTMSLTIKKEVLQ